LFVSALFILVEVIPVFMTIITPADSADRLAVAIRDAFADKIPALAHELSDTAQSCPSPNDPEPPGVVVDTEKTHGNGSLRRSIGVVIVTVVITGGMMFFGRTLGEAIAAGGLFVAVASKLFQYERRNKAAV
jgi:hypothetical protein